MDSVRSYGTYEVARSDSLYDINVAKFNIIRTHLVNPRVVWGFTWKVEHLLVDWRSHEPSYQVRVYTVWQQREI